MLLAQTGEVSEMFCISEHAQSFFETLTYLSPRFCRAKPVCLPGGAFFR